MSEEDEKRILVFGKPVQFNIKTQQVSHRYTIDIEEEYKRRFEWDWRKGEQNVAKHGVSFEEACEVFADQNMLRAPARKRGERRFLAIGMASERLLAVIFTERGDSIRIISARRATERERRLYHGRG